MKKGVIIGVGGLGTYFMNYLSRYYELNLVDKVQIQRPKGRFFKLDVTDPESVYGLEAAIADTDFVIYTAWHNPEVHGEEADYRKKAEAVHVTAARRIYEIAKQQRVRRVIDISTMSVYNKPKFGKIPNLKEDRKPNPRGWDYSVTKLRGERELEQIATLQTQGIVLRLVWPLDPKSFEDPPAPVCTHYEDIAEAVLRAIRAYIFSPFEVINIGSPHPDSNVNIDKARDLLGFNPKHMPKVKLER